MACKLQDIVEQVNLRNAQSTKLYRYKKTIVLSLKVLMVVRLCLKLFCVSIVLISSMFLFPLETSLCIIMYKKIC